MPGRAYFYGKGAGGDLPENVIVALIAFGGTLVGGKESRLLEII